MRQVHLATIIATLFATPLAAEGDPVVGEQVFRKCVGCHKIGEGAKNSVGPVLTGVVGRVAGSYEGYRYGRDMVAAGQAGLVWTGEQVFDYLADPKAFIRAYLDDGGARVKMSFRLADEADREDVIAYLATFSDG